MKIKRVFIKIAGVFIFLFLSAELFYLFAIPKIINLPERIPVIEKIFKEKTGLTLNIKKVFLKTHKDFTLSLGSQNINITDTDGDTVFNADLPYIRINPFSIFLKKVSIKNISSQNIVLNFSRYDETTFGADVFSYNNSKIPFDIDLSKSNISISSYKIILNDTYLRKFVILEGSSFNIKPIEKNLSKLITKGHFQIDNNISDFDINIVSKFFIKKKFDLKNYSALGKITNINLKSISPYIEQKTGLKDAKGIININFNSLSDTTSENSTEINILAQNISVNENDYEKRFVAKNNSKINIIAGEQDNNLVIKNFSLVAENIDISAQGEIKNYKKDKPIFDIDVNLNPSKSVNILDIMPYGVCKEINILKKYGISADVSAKVKISGKLPKPQIYGQAQALNAHALRGWEKTHSAIINAVFKDTNAFIDVNLTTPNNQFFKLKGKAFIYDDDWNLFDIETSDALDLKLVQAILVPVSQLFDFPVGPVPELNIKSGTGSSKMHIKGKLEPKEETRIDGYVKINNGVTGMNGLNALVSNLNLDLIFVQEVINYNTKSALLNGFPISATGQTDMYGNIKIDIGANSIKANVLKNIAETSPLLKDAKNAVEFIKTISGNLKFCVTLQGVTDIRDRRKFSEQINDLNINGKVNLHNSTCTFKGFSTPVSGIFGTFNFTDKSAGGQNIRAKIGTSEISADINSILYKDKNKAYTDVKISGQGIKTIDSVNFVSSSKIAETMGISKNKIPELTGRHNLFLHCRMINDFIDLNSIESEIQIIPDKHETTSLQNGLITLRNGNVKIQNLNLKTKDIKISADGVINNVFNKKPTYNISVKGSDISLKTLCSLELPFSEQLQTILKQIKDLNGTINFNLNILKNGIVGVLKVNGLGFRNIKSDIPFYFEEIPVVFTKEKIKIPHISGIAGKSGKAPLFFDVEIKNYMKIPIIKGTAAIKPSAEFVERYINTKLSHPLKINGDISVNTEISGSIDSLKISPVIKINKDADISYLSVNLGDTDILREIKGEFTVHSQNILIKKIEYIQNQIQANKIIPLKKWNINGLLAKGKNSYEPVQLSFVTYKPLPAKLLNFVFKKSLIKSGDFNCNLSYKPNNKNEKIKGFLTLKNAAVPLYNTVIDFGKLEAENNKIILSVNNKTENTDYCIKTEIKNDLSRPICISNLDIKTNSIDLARMMKLFNQWSIDSYLNTSLQNQVDLNIFDIIVKNGKISAKSIIFKTCPINDFSANFSLDKNSVLKINTNDFKMASGTVNGSISYNFKDGYTESKLKAKSIDSNLAAESFFGLRNQITGKLDGNVNISTFGSHDVERVKNMNGIIGFHMEDGTIPKLGSVEYLLRASNVFQSALTSLSVNNLIELFKPFKTGIYSKISGCLYVNNGILKNIAVFSQGKTLSIYLTGDYNISDSEADVTVFGKLGKKTDSVFGPVGNLSANTLFSLIPYTKNTSDYEQEISKIPDIDFKNNDVKIFRAKVKGDINNDNVSTSFRWVK